jgi:hypothetical protein
MVITEVKWVIAESSMAAAFNGGPFLTVPTQKLSAMNT